MQDQIGALRILNAIPFIERNIWTDLEPQPDPPDAPEPAPPAPEAQPQSAPLPTGKRAPRASRPAFRDDPELHMPTLENLERQIRRQPIGRVFLDISLDLGVVPGFCDGAFWNTLFQIMTYFGSSVGKLMEEKTRRRVAFDKEQDRIRDRNFDWIDMSREKLRQVLGFFIGEPPINPLDPAAAIATAPP